MRRALTLAVVVLSSCEASQELLPDGGRARRDAGTLPSVAPCLEVRPSSIDFGQVQTPLNAFERVELINNSKQERLVHALPRPGPFFVSPLDGVDVLLPPKGQRPIEVQFLAGDALLHLGAIELTAGDDCTTSITLRGLGSGLVTMIPAFADFGFAAPGESKTLEVRLTNTRRTTVPVLEVRLQSRSVENAFSADLPAGAFDLEPLSTVTFTVTARPPTDLTFDAELVAITSFGVVRADLRVVGGAPVAQVTPAVLDVPLAIFEPGLHGARPFVERSVWLRNASTLGRSPFNRLMLVPPFLRVEQLDGGPAPEVTATLPDELRLSLGLDLGEELELPLRVTPIATGARSYRVQLLTNDPQQPAQSISLSVKAVTLGRCALRVVPEESLQLVAASDGRALGTISFINEGSNRCIVDDPRLEARSSPDFFLIGAPPQLIVEPGQTGTLTVEGPRSLMPIDGIVGFHVLNPDSARQFIQLRVPP